MPAVYAHDRFGRKVFECMEGELAEIIENHYPQFQIGLQGPDIFFFCRPWCGIVNRYGNHLHDISAYPFFQHGRKVVREKGRRSGEYAYLLGFICHFILDSECHPYVEAMIEETGVRHLEIEEEFEKLLLRMDGEDALAYPVADLIPTDEETAAVIAPFYAEGITPGIVRRSLKDMKLLKRIFTAPGFFKHGIVNTLLKLSGHYASVKGLLHQKTDNPACRESNEGLLRRFEDAVELAAEMMEEFDDSLFSRKPLNRRFDRNFE